MNGIRGKLTRIQKVYLKDWSDAFTWLVLALLLLWVTAKALGWINTPDFIEFSPYIGAVLLAIKFFQRFAVMETKVNGLDESLKVLHVEMKEVKNELHRYDNRLTRFEAKPA